MSNLDLLIFTPTLDGGVGRVIHNLAEGLAARGYKLEVVTTQVSAESFISDKFQITNLNIPRTVKCLPALIKILKRTQPRVFLSAIYHGNLVAMLARKLSGSQSRLIFCEHIALGEVLAEHPAWLRQVFSLLITTFYRFAAGIVVVSQDAVRDLMHLKVPRQKIHVIYNPIISEEFYRLADQTIESDFRDGDSKVILGIGRLVKQKDFETLIRAFRLVRDKIKAKLVILGTGPDLESLEDLAKKLELSADVSFLGFKKNPYPYIKQTDLFVLSSRYEGLPTVLIEALALHKSIVSTDCHSGPREILQDGKLGKLVAVEDVAHMAAAMVESLNSGAPMISDADIDPYRQETSVKAYEKLLFV